MYKNPGNWSLLCCKVHTVVFCAQSFPPEVSVVLHKLNKNRIHLLHHESVNMCVMSVSDVNTKAESVVDKH